MTPKQRITVAMRGGRPECVPVTLGASEMLPVRFTTGDYVEFFHRQNYPLWKARVEVEHDRFGADAFLHLGAGPSPHDPPRERIDVVDAGDRVTWTDVIHTPHGDLTARRFLACDAPPSTIEPFVKAPEGDADKVLDLLGHPDTAALDETARAYREIGQRAHVGFWLPMPVDWWGPLRGCQQMVMDLIDRPELMTRLFDAYADYACALLDRVFTGATLDSLGLGGSYTSMSLISPELHRRFSLPYGRRFCEAAHRHDKPVQYHMCGRSRQALPITAAMGVDGFDALECPPTGDVDLAEVKRTFGDRISLRGNVNSIHTMLNGSPQDVRRDVARCMDAAKAGGGFILGIGDQVPWATPEENLHAYVDEGLRLGVYPGV